MTLKKRKNKYFRLPLKWKTVINTSGKLNISIWRWEETAHIKYPKYTKKAIKHQENKRNMGIFLFSLIEEPRCVTGFEFRFRNRKGPGGAPLNPPRAAELWCLPQNSSGTPPAPSSPSHPKGHGQCHPQTRFTTSPKHIKYHSAAQIRTGLFSSATKGFFTF